MRLSRPATRRRACASSPRTCAALAAELAKKPDVVHLELAARSVVVTGTDARSLAAAVNAADRRRARRRATHRHRTRDVRGSRRARTRRSGGRAVSALALARLPVARLFRTRRAALPLLGWCIASLGATLLARHANASSVDRALLGAFVPFVMPLVAYAIASAALGGEGVVSASRPLVRFGASPRASALVCGVVASLASALVCSALGALLVVAAHNAGRPAARARRSPHGVRLGARRRGARGVLRSRLCARRARRRTRRGARRQLALRRVTRLGVDTCTLHAFAQPPRRRARRQFLPADERVGARRDHRGVAVARVPPRSTLSATRSRISAGSAEAARSSARPEPPSSFGTCSS